MPIRTVEEMLNAEIGETPDYPLVPEDDYNAVIVEAVVGKGPKGPYVKTVSVIHGGDYDGQKVWRNASTFSEGGIDMPGGASNLIQAVNPNSEIDRTVAFNALPAALAEAALSTPVVVTVVHEHKQRKTDSGSYVDEFDLEGNAVLRASVRSFAPAPEDFVAAIEMEAAGVDDDLPF